MSDDKTSSRVAAVDQEKGGQANPEHVSLWEEREPEDATYPYPHIVSPPPTRLDDWDLFGASLRGKSHAHAGTYREDAFSLTLVKRGWKSHGWVIAVADGAGSCKLSRRGANLAVETATDSLRKANFSKSSPLDRLEEAASSALTALKNESKLIGCDTRDLSCTLLILLWLPSSVFVGGEVFTFQAGDGLIAETDQYGAMDLLAQPTSGTFAGEAHFLTSEYVRDTWNSRFYWWCFQETPASLLVMSDGIADDLIPYAKNGPTVVRELFRVRDYEEPAQALVDPKEKILTYEKSGSFDDRTLVCALRKDKQFSEPGSPSSLEKG